MAYLGLDESGANEAFITAPWFEFHVGDDDDDDEDEDVSVAATFAAVVLT